MGTKELWEQTLVEIEIAVSKANFNTWFKNTAILKKEDGIVHVSVPNEFTRDWLVKKYHKFILKTLRETSEGIRSIEYIIVRPDEREKIMAAQQKQPTINTELPLNDFYINKDDNLNPRYTFDSFVVGSFNELAHAAAQAVIKNPGTVYNPLFIHGNTGHGKTHITQAIGNAIKDADKNKRVFYVTSEKFVLDYITAIQNNRGNTFKEKYRKYDVLIMDDIQFLAKKEKTQEELFHLFNSMYDSNKQIIFSSDKHPNYIPELEDRLRSRFSAGMIIDIPEPDHESRIAILKSKLSKNEFALKDDLVDFIAEEVQGNIRELEGILNSIICQSRLKSRELTINELKNLVRDTTKPKKTASVKEVVKTIAEFFNTEEEMIYKKTRRKEVVKPRQIIMYILREDFHVSYPSIGQKIGGRDHTTVIHSCEKIKNELKVDSILAQEIQQIRSMLK
ncbi:chromosomal replication initiator protein DnaA [Candidatus Wolfebacteria bacterium]|nr:MAG: chromosomal replication initiator protein DnaA [Candidatus Wolfebacteria bacterium]